MIDQELSLFYDQPQTFAITELGAPLPEADEFWLSKSATEWRSLYDRENGAQQDLSTHLSLRPQYSLRRLFQLCLDDELKSHNYRFTPLRLRLLLYPLQGLIFHHSQLLDAFPDTSVLSTSGSKTTTRTSSILRLEELQSLLRSWWDLSQTATNKASVQEEAFMNANLILYHLVSLNLYAGIKVIESFARGEGGGRGSGEDNEEIHEKDCESDVRQRYLTNRCVFSPHDALYHAGQVLRLVLAMPVRLRPPWWAAAIYRAALVLWAYSMAQAPSSLPATTASRSDRNNAPALGSNYVASSSNESSIQINAMMPSDPAIIRFLRLKRGVPVLVSSSATPVLRLNNPRLVLQWCIDALNGSHQLNTWFTTGVKMKLEMLLQAWTSSKSAKEEKLGTPGPA